MLTHLQQFLGDRVVSSSRGLWIIFLSSILSALVGVIGTILAQYYFQQRSDLYAVVHSYPHYHLFDWSDTEVRQRIRTLSLFDRANRVEGVYRVSLLNKGTSLATGVRAYSDGAIGSMMSKDDQDVFHAGEDIDIGDIRPGEEIELIFWVHWLRPPSMGQDANIQIRYDNGIVEIQHWGEIDGYSSILIKLLRDNLGAFNIFLAAFLLIYLTIVVVVQKGKKSQQSTDDDESE